MNDQFREHLSDLLGPLGGVEIRKFFGGLGISRDGLMFGMVIRDQLYFHVDETTRPRYLAEGSVPFRYTTKVKEVVVESFYSVPDALFDEPDDFVAWAKAALEAAAAKKRKKPRSNAPAKSRRSRSGTGR